MSIYRVASCLVVAVLLAGLAAIGAERGRADEVALRRELKARGLDPDEIVFPHAIDQRMVDWLAVEVPRHLADDVEVRVLLEQLLSHNELDLEYHRGYTATAIEAFESQQANCLAFTHLFVGLARQLDLSVFYLKVEDLESFDREGDLVVISGHVTAGYGSRSRPEILEFSILPVGEYRNVVPLTDISALALFYSNRGAELLLSGDLPAALEWLETAVRIDPALPDAWVNVGVTYRRSGQLEAAERSYWRAIEVDPGYAPAYQNLSVLLQRIGGREEEGRQILALSDQKENRNPFNYLALGDLSLDQGRLSDAERYYRRALSLSPETANTQAAMGRWSLVSGRPRRARKWLKRARKADPGDARVRRLAAELSVQGGPS